MLRGDSEGINHERLPENVPADTFDMSAANSQRNRCSPRRKDALTSMRPYSISWVIQMQARRSIKVVAGRHLPAEDNSVRKTSVLRCILDFASALNRKRRDREIERLIARSGGRFTDELERHISEVF